VEQRKQGIRPPPRFYSVSFECYFSCDTREPTFYLANQAYVWERPYRINQTNILPDRMDNYWTHTLTLPTRSDYTRRVGIVARAR
jgi:hypothetical protein